MFVSIYSSKRVKELKRNLLLTGVLLASGGSYATARELFVTGTWRPEWFVAALVLLVVGVACVAVARDVIPLKDAYFLMNPSRLSFRLTFFGREQMLQWTDVTEVRASDEKVVFELRDEKEVTLRLSTIPDEQVARHIRASISLAALEQNIKVNGVLAKPEQVVSGS